MNRSGLNIEIAHPLGHKTYLVIQSYDLYNAFHVNGGNVIEMSHSRSRMPRWSCRNYPWRKNGLKNGQRTAKIHAHANIIVGPLGIVETILKVLGLGSGLSLRLGPWFSPGLSPGFSLRLSPGMGPGIMAPGLGCSGQWSYQRQNKEEHKKAEEVNHW